MLRRLSAVLAASTIVLSACGSNASSGKDFNDADVMFAQMMIPHHEQAIEMSDIALDPTVGAGAEVASLAAAIKGAQDPEITQMAGLLSGWGKPTMAEDGMDHSSMMGGMLTPDELDALGKLRGADFDAQWARSMIEHHEGAIDMANDVLADGKNAEIRALAEAIVATQAAEIETLKPLAGS